MQSPNSLAELQAMMAAGQFPLVPPAAQIPAPHLDIPAMIKAEFDRRMPAMQSSMSKFEDVFKRALSAEDYVEFTCYAQAGAPGFNELLASDKLFPLAQLLWETIKEIKT